MAVSFLNHLRLEGIGNVQRGNLSGSLGDSHPVGSTSKVPVGVRGLCPLKLNISLQITRTFK